MRQFFCALFLVTLGTNSAISQQLERVIVAPNAVELVDGMASGKREEFISLAGSRLKKSDPEFANLVNLLCEINAWTTGSDDVDQNIQLSLWQLAAEETRPWTDLFGALDCAAANRSNFYFSDVVEPIADLRRNSCDADEGFSTEISKYDELITTIEGVDAAILRGLTLPSYNPRKTRSFFPLRNAPRRAMLEVAKAVEQSKSDWATAAKSFRRAAEILEEWNVYGTDETTKILLKNTRNGWRFHNDLTLYASLYRWLAGDTNTLDLEELATWPTVKSDKGIVGAIAPGIERRMPSNFVDYIYVERLFPGAAMNAKSECQRWRQRSYDTHEFADHLKICIQGSSVTTFQELQLLDTCIAGYQASDWRVQFLAFKKRNGWESTAEDEIRRVREALATSDNDLSDVIASLFPDEGSFIRIMTSQNFTTERINEIRSSVREIYPDALFARPTLY